MCSYIVSVRVIINNDGQSSLDSHVDPVLPPAQGVYLSVAQLGLVAVLPDLGQYDGGVEAEEDAQRQGHPLDHGPRLEAEKVELQKMYKLCCAMC